MLLAPSYNKYHHHHHRHHRNYINDDFIVGTILINQSQVQVDVILVESE